jgi:hypothetical protein
MQVAYKFIANGLFPIDRMTISLQAYSGDYLRAVNGGGDTLMADRATIGAHEIFHLYDLNAGTLVDGDPVFIDTDNGEMFVAQAGGCGSTYMDADADERGHPYTVFFLENISDPGQQIQDGHLVALRNYNGCYASAASGGGGTIPASAQGVSSWERFTLIIH